MGQMHYMQSELPQKLELPQPMLLEPDLLRHLPGIKQVRLGTAEAVIEYKSGLQRTITADQHLIYTLLSFLVPVQFSAKFQTLLEYNRAMDGLDEDTEEVDILDIAG